MTIVNKAQDRDWFPAYVVWELTLRCDQPCAHCGSRAGKARENELGLAQALDVVQQLRDMRAREVVLIGGEAYLHEGFLQIIAALKQAGIRVTMTTGGRGITETLAKAMKKAGLDAVSVSIDGLEAEHDAIRKAKGSFRSALAALGFLRDAGLTIAANTNINRVNRHVLSELFEVLSETGIKAWQVQITVPLGRAADRPQMLLQPYDLPAVMEEVARLKRIAFTKNVIVMPGNNLGYFGTEEALLRSVHAGGHDHWQGCQAGRRVLGIESSGAVKGCPSLPSSAYVGGSLREQSLEDIWHQSPELAFTRSRSVDDLWGYCRDCTFAETCLGGCSFTAHSLFGRPGNNPFCVYRVRALAKQGLRERLVAKEAAPGQPFDHGSYALVQEPHLASALDLGAGGHEQALAHDLVQLTQHDLVQLTRRTRPPVLSPPG